MTTEYEHVREFNIGAGQDAPDTKRDMTRDEVFFLAKMILDELMEFMVTRYPNYKNMLIKLIQTTQRSPSFSKEQIFSLTSIYYQAFKVAVKAGMRIDMIFTEVHEANMNKRNPETGQFQRREDGKIIKPSGWVAPDIEKVVSMMEFDDGENMGLEYKCIYDQTPDIDRVEIVRALSDSEMLHYCEMVVLHLIDLVHSQEPNSDRVQLEFTKMIVDSRDLVFKPLDNLQLIAEQADAMVDCNYYLLNACVKCGLRVDKFFFVCQEARSAV